MYRISRVLEMNTMVIVKVAGQVTDSDVAGWSEFLSELVSETMRWIVLDFCDVSRVDQKPAEWLVRVLPEHVLLLNCPVGIKNAVESAGRRNQVLDCVGAPGRVRCFLSLRPSTVTAGMHRADPRGGGIAA
jgi:hypothetical protein